MAHHRSSDGRARQRQAGFDLADRLRLHLLAVLREQRPERRGAAKRAQRQEDRVRSGEVGPRLLDDAPERLEAGTLLFEHGAHARIQRQPAEIGAPGDTRSTETAVQRPAKHRRIERAAARVAGIRAGHRAEEECDVGHRSRHRTVDRESQ